MSYTISIICADPTHPPLTLTTMTNAQVFGDDLGWAASDPRCDMSRWRDPADGYSFRCDWCRQTTRVDRQGLHDRLDTIRASSRAVIRVSDLDPGVPADLDGHAITTDGLRAMQRFRDPLRPPTRHQPPPEGGGFLMQGGRT